MSEVVKYLQSYKDNFWQYEDAGNVIAIPGGKTIGYSKLVLSEIVDQLAPQGLPRFGSLLLALVATNPHAEQTLENILDILEIDTKNSEIQEGLKFALLLTKLPYFYKKGEYRLDLLRTIFYKSHNSIGESKSNAIQLELKRNDNISNYSMVLTKRPLPVGFPILDFKTLGLIGRDLTTIEAIQVRMANLPAVDEVFEELEFEEQNKSDDNLIEHLVEDHKTFHVGALVSRLMSGLNIPFHSSLPSQQPLGGVADITNKGNFDKLLISEFAFDDVILMSRLANNESLYKHREVPPSDNNYNRVIIIDVTLKNWGTVRTISFASMLAITNHPKSANPCRVFLVGKSYKEVPFGEKSDIVKAMMVMDSSLDPGVGLMKLFTEEQIEVSEIFFIGHQETLSQPTMQLFSAEYGKRIDHWIHPTAEGVISVYKNPKRGKRFVQELKLPLNEAWQKPKEPRKDSNQEYPIPILFPNGVKERSRWVGRDFSYVTTKEKALFRYYGSKGANLHSGLELINPFFSNSYNIKAVMTHEDMSLTILVSEPNKVYSLITSEKRVVIDSQYKLAKHWNYHVENDYFVGGAPLFSYMIQLDGKVTKRESGFKAKLRNPPISYHKQIYRNLKTIVLTSEGRLRFGKHELFCINGSLMLRVPDKPSGSGGIVAEHCGNGYFEFPNGNKIQHNRNGMLTIIPSPQNKEQSLVYIPCVLRSALGVATETIFAGDRYYRKELRSELIFDDERFMSKEIVRMTLEDVLEISMREAKLVNLGNGIVVSDSLGRLEHLQKRLRKIDVQSSIQHRGINQTTIPPDEFYQKYIQSFINEIIFYGN